MQATGGVNTTLAHAQVFLVRVAQGLRTFALTLLTTFLRRRYGIWYVQLVTQSTVFSAPRTCYEAADGELHGQEGTITRTPAGSRSSHEQGTNPATGKALPPSFSSLPTNRGVDAPRSSFTAGAPTHELEGTNPLARRQVVLFSLWACLGV